MTTPCWFTDFSTNRDCPRPAAVAVVLSGLDAGTSWGACGPCAGTFSAPGVSRVVPLPDGLRAGPRDVAPALKPAAPACVFCGRRGAPLARCRARTEGGGCVLSGGAA